MGKITGTEHDNKLSLAEVRKDPIAAEIWKRLAASSDFMPDFSSENVWSDSPAYPMDPNTGP